MSTTSPPHPLTRLAVAREGSVWIVFPTRNLRDLWQRHHADRYDFLFTWTDTKGFGLHAADPYPPEDVLLRRLDAQFTRRPQPINPTQKDQP